VTFANIAISIALIVFVMVRRMIGRPVGPVKKLFALPVILAVIGWGDATRGLHKPVDVTLTVEVLAAVAGQQDNPQRAVRLLAAARSILDARGSGWLHAYQPRVPHDDAVLAALRSRMGDAAFEEAQAWGGSAGSKRAVEYALEQA
jgi:hypothetical protein